MTNKHFHVLWFALPNNFVKCTFLCIWRIMGNRFCFTGDSILFMIFYVLVRYCPITPITPSSAFNYDENEPQRKKAGLWGLRPVATQISLYSHRRLEILAISRRGIVLSKLRKQRR